MPPATADHLAISLQPDRHRYVLAELTRRLEAIVPQFSLPRPLAEVLCHGLLPEVYAAPRCAAPAAPCPHPAGSPGRIEAMRQRVSAGQPPFNRGHDCPGVLKRPRQLPAAGEKPPAVASVDDVLSSWMDVLGRPADSLARRLTQAEKLAGRLRAELKASALTCLGLREQLRRANRGQSHQKQAARLGEQLKALRAELALERRNARKAGTRMAKLTARAGARQGVAQGAGRACKRYGGIKVHHNPANLQLFAPQGTVDAPAWAVG